MSMNTSTPFNRTQHVPAAVAGGLAAVESASESQAAARPAAVFRQSMLSPKLIAKFLPGLVKAEEHHSLDYSHLPKL